MSLILVSKNSFSSLSFRLLSFSLSSLFSLSLSLLSSLFLSLLLLPQAKELDEKLEKEFYLQRGIRFHPTTGEPFEGESEKEEGKGAGGERESERPLKRAKKEEVDGEAASKSDGKEREKTPLKEKVESSGLRFSLIISIIFKFSFVSVSFRCVPIECEDALPPLPRNFVITSAEAGIKYVKQFIIQQVASSLP